MAAVKITWEMTEKMWSYEQKKPLWTYKTGMSQHAMYVAEGSGAADVH